jgi:hypothetical protein
MTPSTVHYGQADSCTKRRQKTLFKAFAKNPERFVRGMPQPMRLRSEAWINPPPDSPRWSSGTKCSGVNISAAE